MNFWISWSSRVEEQCQEIEPKHRPEWIKPCCPRGGFWTTFFLRGILLVQTVQMKIRYFGYFMPYRHLCFKAKRGFIDNTNICFIVKLSSCSCSLNKLNILTILVRVSQRIVLRASLYNNPTNHVSSM